MEYTAKPETEYQGKTLNVKNYNPSQTITVKASGNVINVYYTIPLTITAATKSKPYDGTPLNGEYTVTGALNADAETINTALGTAPSITYVSESPKAYLTETEQAAITGIPEYYDVKYTQGELSFMQNTTAIIVEPGSGSKVYDGTALTRNNPVRDITVSGDGFVSGEEPMYKITGSQTEVGSSENAFEYFTSTGVSSSAFGLFKAEEKGFNIDNYNITKVYGMLTVTEAPAPTPSPGGGNNPPAGGGGNPGGGGGNPAVAGPAIPAQTIADNPGPTTIGDDAAPKTVAAYWALINLICAILTAILSIIMLIRYFTRRKE